MLHIQQMQLSLLSQSRHTLFSSTQPGKRTISPALHQLPPCHRSPSPRWSCWRPRAQRVTALAEPPVEASHSGLLSLPSVRGIQCWLWVVGLQGCVGLSMPECPLASLFWCQWAFGAFSVWGRHEKCFSKLLVLVFQWIYVAWYLGIWDFLFFKVVVAIFM